MISLFAVALEPLGAAVPARYQAGRVEHVDRVVGDPLDQNAVTAFYGRCFAKTLALFHFSTSTNGAAPLITRLPTEEPGGTGRFTNPGRKMLVPYGRHRGQ